MATHEIISWHGGTDMRCSCGADLAHPCEQITQTATDAGLPVAELAAHLSAVPGRG